jgi:curved DNA-binding protein CbpA
MESDDPYAILGVAQKATPQEIKKRYREAVKHCHPDLGPEPERIALFKRVTNAYSLLSDPARRAAYDQEREVPPPAAADDFTQTARASSDSEAAAAREQERERQTNEVLTAGQASLAAKQFGAAEEAGRLVLRWNRNSADAYVLIAEALSGQNRFAEARGCLHLALQIKPSHPEARNVLRRMQNRQSSPAAGNEDQMRQRP